VSRRALIVLTAIAAVARLANLLWLHPLNWDELEYFHATDRVRQGLVPYRDFWEHHSPLQWFVFAPFSAFARAEGVWPVVFMRLVQVPLWIATFVLLARWMGKRGIAPWARWASIVLALCSSFFMLAAVEYRIDALGCFLIVLALVLFDEHPFAAGAAIALAGFANIRFGPLLACAMVAIVITRRRRALAPVAGAAVATALCVAYFVATHSAAIAWQYVWTDNYLADALAPATIHPFLRRLAVPLGAIHWSPFAFSFASVEPATIIILIAGLIGTIRALWRRDLFFVLAILQIVNVLFIAKMKFVWNYHFGAVVILALPFVAMELERIRSRQLVVALLVLASCVNIFGSLFRGKEADFAYQDAIMRDVHRVAPAGTKVFDGAGWALRREPAYRHWFLRGIVNVLEANGRFPRYGASEMALNPPAAIITDNGVRVWFATHRELPAYVAEHYVPLWRDLWVPGLRRTLAPGQTMTWQAPRAGEYVLYAAPGVAWNGGGRTLRSDDVVMIANRSTRTNEVTVVPRGVSPVYRQPPPGVDIDGFAPPVTHIPDLSWRRRSSSTATAF
jgi:hypothetical protein